MMDANNQKTYTAPSIVQHYAQLSTLQPAETLLLNLEQLSTLKMLDLGVGGGRTTKHFAPLVAEYIGLDYSAEMIASCQQRFDSLGPTVSLAVGDARDLSRFRDNYFDLILFSFNGIDSISHVDRLQVLSEISRVGKSGGYFCFSSHNLQGLEREFEWRKQLSFNPMSTYVNLVMWLLLRCCNRSLTQAQLKASAHVIVRDEAHNFRLQTYYVRPQAQLQQLESHFRNIKVYSWKNVREIKRPSELDANSELWLYYLCLIR